MKRQITTTDQTQMTEALKAIYSKALDGASEVFSPVEHLVAEYSQDNDDLKAAARKLARTQMVICGASGFASGVGGLATLPYAVPINLASVFYVQLRMVAAIAQMGGYDARSDRTQAMVLACMTGHAAGDVLKDVGVKIGTECLKSAISRIPGSAITAINRKVGFMMITKAGTTGAINLTKLVPVAGGVIGGAFDVATTKAIAETAISIFIDGKIPPKKEGSRTRDDYLEIAEFEVAAA